MDNIKLLAAESNTVRSIINEINDKSVLEKGRIYGQVWYDENKNKTNDNEKIKANYDVTLKDKSGNIITQIVTDEQGNYEFKDLEFGTYYLEFYKEKSEVFTTDNVNTEGKTNAFELTLDIPEKEINVGISDGKTGGGSSGGGSSKPDKEEPEEETPKFELEIDDDGNHEWYLRGYEDYTFRVDGTITREEVATIFYRLTTTPEGDLRQELNVTEDPYKDVSKDRWSARPIAYMKELGIMQGYSNGNFEPSKPITRAEFAQVIMKYIKYPTKNENMFKDLEETYWATEAIEIAAGEGWIKGYEDGTFRPEKNITRVEVVVIINRMLNRKVNKEELYKMTTPLVDLDPNHWGYADIMEAITRHEYDKNEAGEEMWTSYSFPFHEDMSDDAYNDV